MFLGIEWSTWLTAAFIVGTVLVGIFGLFQESLTQKGKLTGRGRLVVILMVTLGVLSFASGQLDRRNAEEKERADAALRQQQFHLEIRSLSRLETGMSGSLGRLEDLYGIAGRNLRMSGSLQEQTRENTNSVLRRVFAESNRIAAERIAISVSYQCPPLGPYIDGPGIESVTLIVRDPSRSQISLSTRQKLNVGDGIMFHGFLGDLGPYETFPAWRTARVSIHLDGVPPTGRVLNMDEILAMTEGERERWARVDRSISCAARVVLLLNGRQVVNGVANLRRVREYEFDAEFNDLRIDANRLPRF